MAKNFILSSNTIFSVQNVDDLPTDSSLETEGGIYVEGDVICEKFILTQQITLDPLIDEFLTIDPSTNEMKKTTLTQVNQNFKVPVGCVLMWGTTSIPSGFFICNGGLVSRTTYADLFAVLGNYYGNGDGSTTFQLPDFRGRFLRGHDAGTGRDPYEGAKVLPFGAVAAGSTIGGTLGSRTSFANNPISFSSANDSGHRHNMVVNKYAAAASGNFGLVYGDIVQGSANYNFSNSNFNGHAHNITLNGEETRPINISVHFIIKY